MRAATAERTLTWLLRLLGVLTVSAVVPMVMPTEWMAEINDWLGLAPLPRTPLTEYLTRSLSAIYALIGALTIYISREVAKYAEFIRFAGALTVLLGVFFVVLDLAVGMPASWAWSEGPPTIVLGFALRWLGRRAGRRAGFG